MDVHFPQHGRIFVVDDDAHVRGALKFTFEADGYEVVALSRGEDLIDHPPRENHTCIVIDQRLTGLSGFETLVRLRAIGVDTPAILITTHPSRSLKRQASQFALDIIEKPLIGDALARRVADLIQV